jgi:sugar lactone lactonase YvrE
MATDLPRPHDGSPLPSGEAPWWAQGVQARLPPPTPRAPATMRPTPPPLPAWTQPIPPLPVPVTRSRLGSVGLIASGLVAGAALAAGVMLWPDRAPPPLPAEQTMARVEVVLPTYSAPVAPVTPPAPVVSTIAAPVPVPREQVVPPRPFRVEVAPLPAPARRAEAGANAAAGPLVVRRRRDLDEEKLRLLIAKVPELALDRTADRKDSKDLLAQAQRAAQERRPDEVGPLVMLRRGDLAGLPLRMGDACKMSPSLADHLQNDATVLRGVVQKISEPAVSRPGEPEGKRPTPADTFETATRGEHWNTGEAVPALNQVLMAENESVRSLLVERLARIPGKQATLALAQRALFDLHPEVRRLALEGLRPRPQVEVVPALLDGLRHPWSVVADHAAEALVALHVTDAVPHLVRLLDEPDPSLAAKKPGTDQWQLREMVRVNHFRNCLMCHAASFDTQDKVRGPIPRPDQPLPSPVAYYRSPGEIFVRADVTYLKQDFSAGLPVAEHGPWPAVQRFDFLVRQRPATEPEIVQAMQAAREPGQSEHRRAVLFALRELTGRDAGPDADDWKALFLPRDPAVESLHPALASAGGVAVDAAGVTFVADSQKRLLLREENDRFVPCGWLPAGCTGLAIDGRGRLVACLGDAGQIAALEPTAGTWQTLAGKEELGRVRGPAHPAPDRLGGLYFVSDDSVCYLSARGNLTRLACEVQRPAGVAVSPDGSRLYVLDGDTREITVLPLEGAGVAEKGRVLCRLDVRDETAPTGGGLAVDRASNLYAVHPGRKAVQVFNREGASLGTVALPEVPLRCAVSGGEARVLAITTPAGIYRVKLHPPTERAAWAR